MPEVVVRVPAVLRSFTCESGEIRVSPGTLAHVLEQLGARHPLLVPRRYFALGQTDFLPASVHSVNEAITISALIVAAAQVVFLYNMIWSYFRGEKAPSNPWGATSLEWQTPDTPPKHGNWGPHLPVVYRWAYDFSVPGAKSDFIPQNEPLDPSVAQAHKT